MYSSCKSIHQQTALARVVSWLWGDPESEEPLTDHTAEGRELSCLGHVVTEHGLCSVRVVLAIRLEPGAEVPVWGEWSDTQGVPKLVGSTRTCFSLMLYTYPQISPAPQPQPHIKRGFWSCCFLMASFPCFS